MKILTVPHPTLKQKCEPVTKVDKKLVQFVKEFENTLHFKKNPEGVGLSAPQVGKTFRLFSTYVDQGEGRLIKTYINPRLVRTSPKITLGGQKNKPFLEGCLSIPYIYGPVWRHQWVKLEYELLDPVTLKLTSHSSRFESFPARVIQHELDHLDGILFTERAMSSDLPIYQEIDNQLVAVDYA